MYALQSFGGTGRQIQCYLGAEPGLLFWLILRWTKLNVCWLQLHISWTRKRVVSIIFWSESQMNLVIPEKKYCPVSVWILKWKRNIAYHLDYYTSFSVPVSKQHRLGNAFERIRFTTVWLYSSWQLYTWNFSQLVQSRCHGSWVKINRVSCVTDWSLVRPCIFTTLDHWDFSCEQQEKEVWHY